MEFLTMKKAKEYLRANYEQGTECPCCGQFVKRYRRTITASMAHSLIVFSESEIGEWVHAQKFFHSKGYMYAGGGDFPKLRHWDLIEKKQGKGDDGNPSNGMYRITAGGRLFVDGETRISKHVFLYNQKILRRSEETVSIQEALGNKFDYNEVRYS